MIICVIFFSIGLVGLRANYVECGNTVDLNYAYCTAYADAPNTNSAIFVDYEWNWSLIVDPDHNPPQSIYVIANRFALDASSLTVTSTDGYGGFSATGPAVCRIYNIENAHGIVTVNNSGFFLDFQFTGLGNLQQSNANPYNINWSPPAAINYGTPIGDAQLNATADIPGNFTYSLPPGSILGVGNNTLTAIFKPNDTTTYLTRTATINLSVLPVTAITGHINCTCDGSPVPNVTVQVVAGFNTYSATTDSSGSYNVIGGIPNGTYSIAVNAPNYFAANATVTISTPGSPVTADFAIKPNGQDVAVLNAIIANSLHPFTTHNNTAMVVNFIPANGDTLEVAACKLGFDHFNWYQQVIVDPYHAYYSSTVPYTDPQRFLASGQVNQIPVATGTFEQADYLPFYYNEGAAFDGIDNYLNHIVEPTHHIFQFWDQPREPSLNINNGEKLVFQTQLVGVKPNYTYVPLRTFIWDSTWNGLVGGANVTSYRASLLGDDGGNGGIIEIITNVQPAEISMASIILIGQDGGSFPVSVQPASQTLSVGDTTSLTFIPTNSSSPLAYQWRKNGTNISGATNLTLTLSNLTTNDAAIYDVLLSSTNGSIGSAPATLTVVPMIITTQPTNISAAVGASAALSVNVSGIGPFTYQWRLNGTNLVVGNITTIAGNGTNGYTGDGGSMTNAVLGSPGKLVFDNSGNLYFCDSYQYSVRKIGTNGIITRFAGNGSWGYSGDNGPATNASMYSPSSVAIDPTGNMYVADYIGKCIRKIDTNGIITTYAGGGKYVGGDGGQATNAALSFPMDVAMDLSGNLYIADAGNYRIRKVKTNGIITTVAGNGTLGFSGDGGLATSAKIGFVKSVAVDSVGNIYLFSEGYVYVRKVDTNGIITTIAGNGTDGYSGDDGAATNAMLSNFSYISLDNSGDVLIADSGNNRIRKIDINGIITTVAGNGIGGFSGDGGAATNARLYAPDSSLMDGFGNMYISDAQNRRIRKEDINGVIQTIAGGLPSSFAGDGGPAVLASLAGPNGVAVDASGNIFVADSATNRIRKLDANGMITTVAGNGTNGFSGDGGAAALAALNYPTGVAVDSVGNIFVCDTYNNRIRKVDTNGMIATVAGNGTNGFSGDGGAAVSARLSGPTCVALDASGNLFIADQGNSRIRMVNTNGVIGTFAGGGGFYGNGYAATNAALNYPSSVFVDAVGKVFIADTGYSQIRMVDTNGIIVTVAGKGVSGYSGDGGTATNAGLLYPIAIALDKAGNQFISDQSRIREVTTNGVIATIAGNGTYGYSGDGGPAISAQFYYSKGLAVDANDNIFVADLNNRRIRKVSLRFPGGTSGQVLTLAGLSPSDVGNYSVVVAGANGSLTSAVASVTVLLPVAESLNIQPLTDGRTQITISGNSGHMLSLLGSYDLFHWANIGNYTNSSGTLILTNPTVPNCGLYFYRTMQSENYSAYTFPPPTINSLQFVNDGKVQMQINAPTGNIWQLLGSPDLVYWGNYGNVTDLTGTLTITNTPKSGGTNYFYRLKQP